MPPVPFFNGGKGIKRGIKLTGVWDALRRCYTRADPDIVGVGVEPLGFGCYTGVDTDIVSRPIRAESRWDQAAEPLVVRGSPRILNTFA